MMGTSRPEDPPAPTPIVAELGPLAIVLIVLPRQQLAVQWAPQLPLHAVAQALEDAWTQVEHLREVQK